MDKKLYDLMDWAEIETIVYSEHDHPEKVLGPHKVKGGVLVQAFLPDAKTVFIKSKKNGTFVQMEQADEDGFFAALMAGRKIVPYDYVVNYSDGAECLCKDPYLYTNIIPDDVLSDFSAGNSWEIYRYLGAHPLSIRGIGKEAFVNWNPMYDTDEDTEVVFGTFFAIWAPNVMRVSVVGDFNYWDGRRHPMYRIGDTGVFALFIPDIDCGELYKYELKYNARTIVLKSDPYGYSSELRPANASVVVNLQNYKWGDASWMTARKEFDLQKSPLNVYEVHLGSWMKRTLSDEERELGATDFMNFRDIAPKLAAYVLDMGYTHIELMPVMEHPLDESWGYQVTGYYAVTSRYGTPQDFMYFMDYMHNQGIGVILDWVPAHFPKDEHGLAVFDGTCLYEHINPMQGVHPHWGTLIFNYARPQVANFLIANALFWKDVYHVDGIRMDAVASMLYLDYGRAAGQWIPNQYGGNENLEAIAMLQKLSEVFHANQDGAFLVAEESTSWPMVTGDAQDGGLGFDLKWNMGWMNDFTEYMQLDPLFRKGSHGLLTMSMLYAYSENFILTLSHDEVVHEKGTLYTKMPGDSQEKMGSLRVAYGFMIAHPGKKLLFMGQEFGQTNEWNEKESINWNEMEKEEHAQLKRYVRELNLFYKKHPALYSMDFSEDGFEWISCMDADHSIIAFLRKDVEIKETLLVVCNFTPVLYENFKLGVPFAGSYKEIFNSDKAFYGGAGCTNDRRILSKEVHWDGRGNSVTMKLPPYGFCVFHCVPARK